MRAVFILVLILGVGLAGFAVYLAQDRFRQYQAALAAQQEVLKKQVKLKKIVVVKKPLKYGDVLSKEDVAEVRFPVEAIPDGAFASVEEVFPKGKDGRRFVLRPIEAKEALLASKITKPGEDAGVATRLGKGMRALAIRVDVSSGVSGFLRPGDRVDVYWTGGVQGREVTKLIEAGVKLIAVDQTSDTNRTGPTIARTVTVEAKPQQVAALAQAQATGRLTLSLVGVQDDTTVSSIEVDQYKLLGIEPERTVEVKKKKRVCTIRTRKGGDLVEIPIPCTN
ncbi:MAG: Flp pilus assembly protein CpaB [Alphaproteobacteria bacterium]|nr:MAG: Flp pilus assembly protein CpaB [Alphaproteobacteria bacterium]